MTSQNKGIPISMHFFSFSFALLDFSTLCFNRAINMCFALRLSTQANMPLCCKVPSKTFNVNLVTASSVNIPTSLHIIHY